MHIKSVSKLNQNALLTL